MNATSSQKSMPSAVLFKSDEQYVGEPRVISDSFPLLSDVSLNAHNLKNTLRSVIDGGKTKAG